MSDLIERARAFATKAHEGQVRCYTGRPYIEHPEAVVALLEPIYAGTYLHDEVIAAAWLHDVVEDCPAATDFFVSFPGSVTHLVRSVTKVWSLEATIINLSRGTKATHDIKTVDIIDNCSTLMELDPERAPGYFEKKRRQLDVMQRANVTLLERAWQIVGR